MFVQALKTAVRNQIRTELLDEAAPKIDGCQCQLTAPNGKPFGYSGLVFIAVHGSRLRNVADYGAFHLEVELGFDVTISWRLTYAPDYAQGDRLDDLSQGIDTHTDLIIRALSLTQGFTTLTAANVLITAASELDTFNVGRGIRFTAADDPVERFDRWWGASKDSETPAGYSRKLKFDGTVVFRGQADILI
jgi:hypothetical protein